MDWNSKDATAAEHNLLHGQSLLDYSIEVLRITDGNS